MSFKLSFFSNAFKHFSLEYCVNSLSRLNYDGIELWCKGQHITPYDDMERVNYVKKILSEKDLQISALSAHLDFITPNREMRRENIEKFKKVIELAKKFNVSKVITASGYLKRRRNLKKLEERFLNAMHEIAEKAEDEKIIICLEAEPEKFLRTPEQVVKYAMELGDDIFKATCDLSHAIAIGKTPVEFMEELGSLLCHVHVDDAKYNQKPHKHLIPGDGDVDFEDVFDYLRKIKYKGWLSVELNRHVENPGKAAEKAKIFLERYIK